MARRSLALVSGSALLMALLATSLVAGVAAGGAGCHAGLERDAQESIVRLVGNCMDPMVARVPTGAVVTFVNADGYAHAVTGAASRWGTYDELAEGDTVAYRFTRAGIFPYFCYLHPGMIGAVVVGDGGPGGGGDTVWPAAALTPPPATRQPARATPVPATQAAIATESTASPAAAAATTGGGGSSPSGAGSVVTLALLAVLVAAGAAYGFGLLPGMTRARTRSR